ncbi:MAG: Na+/H+ antiporter NhaC-like protein [Pelosinus sp.]|jgi:NhaC family Na+:H+ antiporter|nr:Na+/H+ antiporter NhaC-like protein [Pelosinus sp.]
MLFSLHTNSIKEGALLDTILIFILFFASLLFAVYHDISIVYPLLFGLICFILVALRRGFTLASLWSMMFRSSQKSLIVIKIFVLIGAITAVWRACGTISFIVYYAIAFMSGKYFILSAFLLSSIVSFLLGTSFGTVGTIGVVLIVLAKSGNVDSNVAAGAIIAGAYFGDRCSPMSSSASLVAALTNTDLYTNLKNMMKTSVLPFALSTIAYAFLSHNHPLIFFGNQIGEEIIHSYNISFIVLLPAILILLCAAFKISVKLSMGLSIISGILIGIYVQHIPFLQMMNYIGTGYYTSGPGLFAEIIQGGGLYSMVSVSLIVLISSAYSGIFEGTGLLKQLELLSEKLSQKIGVYLTTTLTSIVSSAFSCNQTLAVMLTHQFSHKIYEKRQLSNYKLAIDMENTVILISALIPWNIAGAVPAATLSANAGFIIYAFYLFLVPLTNIFTRKILTIASK